MPVRNRMSIRIGLAHAVYGNSGSPAREDMMATLTLGTTVTIDESAGVQTAGAIPGPAPVSGEDNNDNDLFAPSGGGGGTSPQMPQSIADKFTLAGVNTGS